MRSFRDGQGPNSPVGAVGGAAGGGVAGVGGWGCPPGSGGVVVFRAGGGLSSPRGRFRALPPDLRVPGRPPGECLATRRALCPRSSEAPAALAWRLCRSPARSLCLSPCPFSRGAPSTTVSLGPSIPVAPLGPICPVAPSPMSDGRGGGSGGESRPGRSATAAVTARAITAIRSAASRLIRLPFTTLHKPGGPNSAPAAQL